MSITIFNLDPVSETSLRSVMLRTAENPMPSVAARGGTGPQKYGGIPVVRSPAMKRVVERATRFAASSATVLLTGESGTGKEQIANLIHHRSPRAERPYVRVNCAALPASLMDSELFGFERGAFTGAHQGRVGRLAAAEDGTILLDEVSEIPLNLQAKLLRVLEENEYHRIGSNAMEVVQARVVAATNRSLDAAVNGGEFREDLFYRLNVLRLDIPPLRARREDVIPLVEYFLHRYCKEASPPISAIHAEAIQLLQNYHWPGNVRQLRNVIHRACVICENGVITTDHLLPLATTEQSPRVETRSLQLEEIERNAIVACLRRQNNNKAAAARELGISARTLTNKLKKYRHLGYA
jgi:transcriptional regulator with PAS, ATPase and Fis domain